MSGLSLDRTPFERAARSRPKNSQALTPKPDEGPVEACCRIGTAKDSDATRKQVKCQEATRRRRHLMADRVAAFAGVAS